jgi:hypothetical protein
VLIGSLTIYQCQAAALTVSGSQTRYRQLWIASLIVNVDADGEFVEGDGVSKKIKKLISIIF